MIKNLFLCVLMTYQIGKFENCAGDFQTGVKMAQIVSKFESTNAHISTVELI